MALMANFTWLALGEGIGRVVAFGVALYLARVLGAQQFGLLGSAFALVTYFGIFVVGGIDYKGVRDIARTPSAISDIVRVNTIAHFVCLAVVYAVLGVLLAFTPIAPQGDVGLVAVYALLLLAMAFNTAWALRAVEDMRTIALGAALTWGTYAILLLALVRDPDTPLALVAAAQVAGEFLEVAYFYAVLRRRGVRLVGPFAWRRVFATIREALGIMFGRIPRMVYLFGDVLLLAWLGSAAAAGEFLASHRLVLTFVAVGILIRSAILPQVSQLALASPPSAGRMQMDALRNEWLFFAPAWVCCWIYAEPLVTLLFGAEFLPSAAVLRWMLLTVPVVGLSLALQDLLAVVHRDRVYIGANTLAMLVHVAVASLLIGSQGALGAAYAAIVAEALGVVLLFRWRDRDILPARLLGKPLRVLGGAGAMLAAMALLTAWPIWAVVPLGAAVFAATVLALRAVSLADLREMREAVFALASPAGPAERVAK